MRRREEEENKANGISIESGIVAMQNDSEKSVSEPSAPYPTTFSEIVELIMSGQPIPGIKDIPDTVLEGRDSRQTASRRPKPWEKAVTQGS